MAAIRERSLLEKIEDGFNVISHIFIGFNTIFLTYLFVKSGLKNTSLHAFLCVIGYHFLMAEAILCLYSNNSWTISYSRKSKTTWHWVVQVVGCVLAIAGAAIEINAKSTHFTTIHGITGLTATILLCIALVTGLVALYAQRLHKYIKPVLNKSFHNFLGLSGFVIGMVSLYYGYNYGLVSRLVEKSFLHMLKAFTILTIIMCSLGPLKSLFRVARNVIDK